MISSYEGQMSPGCAYLIKDKNEKDHIILCRESNLEKKEKCSLCCDCGVEDHYPDHMSLGACSAEYRDDHKSVYFEDLEDMKILDGEIYEGRLSLYLGYRCDPWGDDWNDPGFEDNAGTVYKEYYSVKITFNLKDVDAEYRNVDQSKEDIFMAGDSFIRVESIYIRMKDRASDIVLALLKICPEEEILINQ